MFNLGIETTGVWTTLTQEQTLMNLVSSSGGSVRQLGLSQEGRPIHEVVLGNRSVDAPVALHVGGIHGNEPAGREALLGKLRDYAFRPTSQESQLLAQTKQVFVATVNPDGRQANRRATEDGLDPNRDALFMTTPEMRALMLSVRDHRPVFSADYHEYSGDRGQVLGHANKHPGTHPDIQFYGDRYVRHMWQVLEGAGFTTGTYTTTNREALNPVMGLHHCLGLLTETPRSHPGIARFGYQTRAFEAWMDLFRREHSAVVHAARASRRWALRHPGPEVTSVHEARVSRPRNLDIAGYQLTAPMSPVHANLFGVQVGAGNFVSIAQESRGIIPELFDPDLVRGPIVPATRVPRRYVSDMNLTGDMYVQQGGVRRRVVGKYLRTGGVLRPVNLKVGGG